MRYFLFIISVLFLATAQFSAVRAQTVVENTYSTSEVFLEQDGVAPGGTVWVALRQELQEGWHVFWVNPGDAGMPLSLDWTLPDGFLAGEVIHPAPEYIPVGPLASYAHEGAPVFLVPITAPESVAPGSNIAVAVEARWQTCETICVPEEGRFSFSMPIVETGSEIPDAAPLFSAARAVQPKKLDTQASIMAEGAEFILRMSAPDGFSDSNAFFFPEPEGVVEAAAPQKISISDDQLTIAMQPGWQDGYEGNSLSGVLSFRNQAGTQESFALEASVSSPLRKLALPAKQDRTANLPLLLVLAFFGGAILNVMPCVFPIVFIKAASFLRSAEEHPAAVRRDGLFYTAGVLAMFVAIGGVLLLLRAGGDQLGWGFHLQSPWVVAFSAYILFLVGLNLSGVFTVGESLTGAGDGLTKKEGALGAFFTGALAVVVAAPCIGPLLSAPMGAAILLPPATGLLIFVVLGLGLAAPYLLLSLAPGLGKRLPKPGPWMALLKQLLAFPVFGAAAYFVWVLAQQAGAAGLAAVLAGCVLLAFAAWGFEHSKGNSRGAFILRLVTAVVVLAAIFPLSRLQAVSSETVKVGARYGAMLAEPYSKDALDAYRADGMPVFVDFTAAWCVTCQVDKATIFSDRALGQEFEDRKIVFMVADWTVRDPEITAALETFGVSGLPFYVYYPPDNAPYVFDIPLTKKAVREAVSGARL